MEEPGRGGPRDLDLRESVPRPEKFRESMPRALIVLFSILVVAGVGLVIWLILRPPDFASVPFADRRSPPRGALTHDVVEAIPAPIPTSLPPTKPPCEAFADTIIEGGPPAQGRLGLALERLCPLAGPGVDPLVGQALAGLNGARLRFAAFRRTGQESTSDLAARRVLLNVGLARPNVNPVVLAPILVHEGWHLAHSPGLVTALEEFRAREAELAACRLLFEPGDAPRGCNDAGALVQLGERRAVDALARAGYPR